MNIGREWPAGRKFHVRLREHQHRKAFHYLDETIGFRFALLIGGHGFDKASNKFFHGHDKGWVFESCGRSGDGIGQVNNRQQSA